MMGNMALMKGNIALMKDSMAKWMDETLKNDCIHIFILPTSQVWIYLDQVWIWKIPKTSIVTYLCPQIDPQSPNSAIISNVYRIIDA